MSTAVRAAVRASASACASHGAPKARRGACSVAAAAPARGLGSSAPAPPALAASLAVAAGAARAMRVQRRGGVAARAMDASATPEPLAEGSSAFQKFSDIFTNLFPLWTVISALVAIQTPAAFNWMSTSYFTYALAGLMFSMGITLTTDDFVRVFAKPKVIGIGFAACYVMMPLLALGIAKLLALPPAIMAGLVVVGSINGGQASNLCTYIAKGDVALSVLMTTSTTIGCIFMTPLIAQLVLGAIVPVDAVGIAWSTIQVVLAPIAAGLVLNTYAPKLCRAVEPACPIIGVIATILLVGASVAQCAPEIVAAGFSLQFACFALHLLGGVAGYWFNRAFGYDETTCRTTAIETSMKSSAFGFLLASLHFGEYLVRVPSAVSVVWMAIMGSSMAVVWRFIPVPGEGK